MDIINRSPNSKINNAGKDLKKKLQKYKCTTRYIIINNNYKWIKSHLHESKSIRIANEIAYFPNPIRFGV